MAQRNRNRFVATAFAGALFGLAALVPGSGQDAVAKTAAKRAARPAITIAAALASPLRPQADRDRDAARRVEQLLGIAAIKPGAQVIDLMPGGGYFTRIFSTLVGPRGHVYSVLPAELGEKYPPAKTALIKLDADKGLANVSGVVLPAGRVGAPTPVSLVWTTQDYHDIYAYFGPDVAAAMNRAVFNGLRKGGHYVVGDHAAPGMTDPEVIGKMHRIDKDTVLKQVLAAGFVLETDSPVLANPADDHTLNVFDPAIRGKTDQFVLVFRKP